MPIEPVAAGPSAHVGLVDAVDHLLNRGAVLSGDATLSVAGVDLVYISLNLLISSVQTLQEHGDWPGESLPRLPAPSGPAVPSRIEPTPGAWTVAAQGVAAPDDDPAGLMLSLADEQAPAEILAGAPDAEREGAERPLARLVLTLVELLRQLVERQALRRMEGGNLSEDQVERMGRSLMELAEKMTELRTLFGLEESDLAIDLGPLGRLL